jgi:hypothetical protein
MLRISIVNLSKPSGAIEGAGEEVKGTGDMFCEGLEVK